MGNDTMMKGYKVSNSEYSAVYRGDNNEVITNKHLKSTART